MGLVVSRRGPFHSARLTGASHTQRPPLLGCASEPIIRHKGTEARFGGGTSLCLYTRYVAPTQKQSGPGNAAHNSVQGPVAATVLGPKCSLCVAPVMMRRLLADHRCQKGMDVPPSMVSYASSLASSPGPSPQGLEGMFWKGVGGAGVGRGVSAVDE
jgi:hypothetical protein